MGRISRGWEQVPPCPCLPATMVLDPWNVTCDLLSRCFIDDLLRIHFGHASFLTVNCTDADSQTHHGLWNIHQKNTTRNEGCIATWGCHLRHSFSGLITRLIMHQCTRFQQNWTMHARVITVSHIFPRRTPLGRLVLGVHRTEPNLEMTINHRCSTHLLRFHIWTPAWFFEW